MKTKQSTISLPTPIELAKLAAILQPDPKLGFAPKHALKKAMEFYLDAVHLLRELPTDFEALAREFGSTQLKDELCLREFENALQEDRKGVALNALKLEPYEDYDEARRYLDEQARLAGVITDQDHFLQSARAVLANLRDYYESIPPAKLSAKKHLTPGQFIESLKRVAADGREYYNIPRSWLASEVQGRDGAVFRIGLVEYKKNRVSDVRKKGAETRKKNRQTKSS